MTLTNKKHAEAVYQAEARAADQAEEPATPLDRAEAVKVLVSQMLFYLGVDPMDENFRETPRRFTNYLLEHFQTEAEIDEVIQACSEKVFPSPYDGMIVQRVSAVGMCPHHLLPVLYKGSVGYIPHERTIGLSKLSRITKACLSQAVLQEAGTMGVADALGRALDTEHVAVLLSGRHMCMSIRGVQDRDSVTVTSELKGAFREDPSARAEFMRLAEFKD